jgi:hypothetical protein
MGHGASCGRPSEEVDFFGAAQSGDLARLAAAVTSRPSLLRRTTLFDRLSALHIAAAHGHLQVRKHRPNRAPPYAAVCVSDSNNLSPLAC